MTIILYVMALSLLTAWASANHIIKGGHTINVFYEGGKQGSTSVVKKTKSSLIGSTDKFMFFYCHSDKRTIVIPLAKIMRITSEKETIKGKS